MPRPVCQTKAKNNNPKNGNSPSKSTPQKHKLLSRSQSPSEKAVNACSMPSFPTPSLASRSVRMTYAIARGEQGVLTFEPYKSILLPHWRFRTVPIAQESSKVLKGAFDFYVHSQDFVGADMARKFIQMGMTRARRYANHKGGKKYDKSERELERDGGERKVLPKSGGHAGMEEKAAASEVFKEVWRACIENAGYLKLKENWKREKTQWERAGRHLEDEEEATVKKEEDDVVKKEECTIVKEEGILAELGIKAEFA